MSRRCKIASSRTCARTTCCSCLRSTRISEIRCGTTAASTTHSQSRAVCVRSCLPAMDRVTRATGCCRCGCCCNTTNLLLIQLRYFGELRKKLDEPRRMFNEVDTDHSGKLDRKEMLTLLRSLSVEPDEIEEVCARARVCVLRRLCLSPPPQCVRSIDREPPLLYGRTTGNRCDGLGGRWPDLFRGFQGLVDTPLTPTPQEDQKPVEGGAWLAWQRLPLPLAVLWLSSGSS